MKKYLSLLIALAFFIPHLAHADITTGLQGWWKFDEGVGPTAIDSSGNGNNGTEINSPTFPAGKIGPYAITFNGTNQYASLGVTNIPQRAPVTVSAWVNFPVTGDTTIIARWDGSTGPAKFNYLLVNTDCYVLYFGTVDIAHVGYTTPSSGWHLMTCAMDTDNIPKMYIDGVLSATGGYSGFGGGTTGAPLSIGAREIAAGPILYTGITEDDVRVYSRALSAADVTELYNYPPISVQVGRLILWAKTFIWGKIIIN